MSRFSVVAIAWALLLALAYALVFGLGGPLPTREQRLAAAMNPAPPVSEAVARSSAAEIVAIDYSHLAAIEPSVERRNDFGIDYWSISYTDLSGTAPSGVRVSIGVETGAVEVIAFP